MLIWGPLSEMRAPERPTSEWPRPERQTPQSPTPERSALERVTPRHEDSPAMVVDVVRVRVPGNVNRAEVCPADDAFIVVDAGGAPRGRLKP